GGITTSPTSADGYFPANSLLMVTAVPNNGFGFVGFGGDLTGSTNPQNLQMTAPKTVIATFTGVTPVTVTSTPPGLPVTVDGSVITTPQTFQWAPGSGHTYSAFSPPQGQTSRYIFLSWNNGQTGPQQITVGTSPVTLTAAFDLQYLVSYAANPAAG